MIAGLDSATSFPTDPQLTQAKAAGVRMWSGYLATKPGVNLLKPWPKERYDKIKAAGLPALAFCSGLDDPVACKHRARDWGVLLCLDVEDGIRGNGAWVQDWLNRSGAGLYGNAPVFSGRTAAFYVLAAYQSDPGRTWRRTLAKPAGPCGWQWQGTHTEFGCVVDRGWFEDWFAQAPSDQWAPMGGSFELLPALATNQDGRLELLVGDDGRLFGRAQSKPNGDWWPAWIDLGALPAGLTGGAVVARNQDGRVEVFLRAGDGSVQHRWQQSAGGPLTPRWASLGGTWTRDPAAALDSDGRLVVFIVGPGDRLFARSQQRPNGDWAGSWSDLGAVPGGTPTGVLRIGRHADGRLAVFVRAKDRTVLLRSQVSAGGDLEPQWRSLGGQFDREPAVASNKDGRLELFAIGGDGRLHGLAQTAPNQGWPSAWKDWGDLPKEGPHGDLGLGRNQDGRLEIFVRPANGEILHTWQTTAGGTLRGEWSSLGGAFVRGPRVGNNQDGRLELFALDAAGGVHHDWQIEPNGSWASHA